MTWNFEVNGLTIRFKYLNYRRFPDGARPDCFVSGRAVDYIRSPDRRIVLLKLQNINVPGKRLKTVVTSYRYALRMEPVAAFVVSGLLWMDLIAFIRLFQHH